MEILSTSQINPLLPESPSAAKKAEDLGREEFLTMLVAQLKNQDPLNPTDGTDFTAQLAQFSSLEQIMKINTNLKGLQSIQNSQTNSMLTGIIGKTVEASGARSVIENGEASDIAYNLSAPAHTVDISIFNSSGGMVKRLSDVNRESGTNLLAWDGKDFNNENLPDGTYSFTVSARDQRGESIESREFLRGVVSAVSYEGEGDGQIWVGPVKVPVENIIKVENVKEQPEG